MLGATKRYAVTITYTMSTVLIVEAECCDKAEDIASRIDFNIREGEYVEGSAETHEPELLHNIKEGASC